MRRIFWKASLAGAVLVVTTVYVAAQMGPGQMPQRPMPREHMMEMMKHMSQMMDRCTNMMQGRDAPAAPEKKD